MTRVIAQFSMNSITSSKSFAAIACRTASVHISSEANQR